MDSKLWGHKISVGSFNYDLNKHNMYYLRAKKYKQFEWKPLRRNTYWNPLIHLTRELTWNKEKQNFNHVKHNYYKDFLQHLSSLGNFF